MEPVDVVISGVGGRFPHANNIEDFGKKLLAGKSLLETATRWIPGAKGTPKNVAMTHEYDKFDYTYFGMHSVLTSLTDPITRIAVETAFEAIVDAGINPSLIRGSNTHVYSGTTQFEPDCTFDVLVNSTGYAIMGRNRCMISNRISYYFNFSGRSCSYDGMHGWVGDGLQMARDAIMAGECDTAIVTGSSLMIFNQVHKTYHDIGLLSPDSSVRPFDEDVNGSARGDAQVAFVVQRADVARRSYGSIVVAQSESQGPLPNWFLSLNEDHLRRFISSVYRQNGLDPKNLKLLEADGLCNKEMVETELNVLDETLNAGRPSNSPLLLGSVKTIAGDAAGAGGFVALIKLILAMESGIISPTINCRRLNPNIKGLKDGRFKVVSEPTKWEVTPDTLVAVSSLTHNGVVSHVTLKANGKTKKTGVVNNYPLPYLILISGRNETVVAKSLKQVTSSPYDPEYLRLTQEVFAPTIDQFEWRGFGYHAQENEKFVIQRENRRPVWFVFSGMGSQWPGMGRELLLFPVIRDTLHRLHRILEPKGVDLITIVTKPDESLFDSILNSFVAITAIQIALTNLLHTLGIKPDGIIGHSVGELGCSYADGCLNEEQTILASYARGVASQKASLVPGLMAAVGLGGDEAQKFLPPEVVVACRNSSESCTISGTTDSVKKVIDSFQSKGIFVRGVNVANIAYHSPYIKPAAPYLLEDLRKVITAPKLRSSKWVCTSAVKEKWNTDEVRYCSAEYHTNNLLSTVYFEEGAAYIPKNALVVEIAPHGLLQAILKRSLGGDVAHVPLTRRGATSPSKYLLDAIGKLFLEGLSPQVWHLYPDVPMPVSRNTPSLVPLIGWEHEEDFKLQLDILPSDAATHEVNYFSPSVEIVGERCLAPAYILLAAWETLAAKKRRDVNSLPVVFEDVDFYDLIKLETRGTIEITTTILSAAGGFETSLKDTIVARGKVRVVDELSDIPLKHPVLKSGAKLCLDKDDIYAEMKNRCVGVSEKMRGISKLEIHPQDWIAHLDSCDGDWNSLLNNLFILYQLQKCEGNQDPAYVNHIHRLAIDPLKKNESEGAARLHLSSSTLIYDGIEIIQLSFRSLDRPAAKSEPASMQFVAYGETKLKNEDSFLFSIIQLCLEKRLAPPPVFKIYDVENENAALAQRIRTALSTQFSLKSEMTEEARHASLILCASTAIRSVSHVVAEENVLLLSQSGRLNRRAFDELLESRGLYTLADCEAKGNSKALVAITSKLPRFHASECEIIKMGPSDKIPSTPISSHAEFRILVWENGTDRSPTKIFNEVLTVEGAEKVRLVFVMTPNTPPFSLENPLYSEQLRLNVPVNVYFDGKWGAYRVIPLSTTIRDDLVSDIVVQPHATANGNSEMKLRYLGLNPAHRTVHKGVLEFSKGIWDYSGEGNNRQRMMGLASFDNQSGCHVRDPNLVWNVPNGWNLEEAATVPCAYSIAYYALLEVARLRPKESIFITCPLTPVGQAAVRIASHLDCDLRVLLETSQERDQLQRVFPNLNSSNYFMTRTESIKSYLKNQYPLGLNVILSNLTGSRLRACCACVGFNSRIVQTNPEFMHKGDYIGLSVFLTQVSMYGITEKGLLESPVDVKIRVSEWIQRGLDDGVVLPNQIRQRYGSDKIQVALKSLESDNVTKRIVYLQPEKINGIIKRSSITGDKSQSVVIGGSKTQWMRIAHYLARKGSKQILIVPQQSSPSLTSRHAQILRREFGAELKEPANLKSGFDFVEQLMKAGPIESVFIFDHDKFSEEAVRQIDSRGLTDTQLVFLSKDSTYFTRMSERWIREGLKVKALLGVEDVAADRVEPLLDWLLSPAAPVVSQLDGANLSMRKQEFATLLEGRVLPISAAELASLGAAIRGKTAPIFREISTQCTCSKATNEIKPLFYLKGIHGRANADVRAIASELLAPMFEITVHETSEDLEATAHAVADGMIKLESRGPFTIAGDPIRTDLSLRVARILEERGFATVVFLMDEGVDDIREELMVLQQGNKLSSSILKSCLFEDVMRQDWSYVDWSQLTWTEQVSIAISKIPILSEEQRENVVKGLEHVKKSMEHIIEAQDKVTLKHSIVRSLKIGDDSQEYKMIENRFEHTVPASQLKNKEISKVLSANLATPVLQLNVERTKGRKLC